MLQTGTPRDEQQMQWSLFSDFHNKCVSGAGSYEDMWHMLGMSVPCPAQEAVSSVGAPLMSYRHQERMELLAWGFRGNSP